MVTLYGIKNCDTMKKAMNWLGQHGITYRFHDFRKDGLDPQLLDTWLTRTDWEMLLNRRGQLWRKVPEGTRSTITAKSARDLMLQQPGIIRRPVLDAHDELHIGFTDDDYARIFRRG